MDATLHTGLQAPAFRMFAATRIDLWNGDSLKLLNGLGVVDIGSDTYVGDDPTYGRVESIDQVTDGGQAGQAGNGASQAPTIKITLLARDNDAVDALIDPQAQGSTVSVSLGLVSAAGVCIGVPEPIFFGEVDVPNFIPSRAQLPVENTCNSVFERFFDRDDGARLSNSFWTALYPGDTGLEDEVSLIKPVYWGEATVDPSNPTGGTIAGQILASIMRQKNAA